MKKKSLLILTVLVLCLAFSINDGEAATYYLDVVNGNDSNPGTSDMPWRTIDKAFKTAAYGDTVTLRNGNYGEINNPISFPVYSGSMVDPLPEDTQFITFKADIGHEPVFTRIVLGSESTNSYIPYIFDGIKVEHTANIEAVFLHNCVGPRFKNSTVIGASSFTGYGIRIGQKGGVISNDIRIENCTVHGFYGGINTIGVNNMVVTNSNVYDIGCDHVMITSGDVAGYNTLIENNHIHYTNRPNLGEHPDGIALADLTDVIIRNNILNDLSQQAIFIHGVGWTSNVLIENNLIYTTLVTEIQFANADHVTIRNNTVVGAGLVQGVLFRGGTGHESYNNIYICGYGAATGALAYHDNNIYVNQSANTVGNSEPNSYGYPYLGNWAATHAAIEPELFVDPANYDFRLKQGCRAVGFADPAYAPATDILGNHRDSQPDAGCYEYGARPPLPLKGDINKDGKVNIQDVQACVNHILGKQDWGKKPDVNGDGKVDEADVNEIVNITLGK